MFAHSTANMFALKHRKHMFAVNCSHVCMFAMTTNMPDAGGGVTQHTSGGHCTEKCTSGGKTNC